MSGNTINVAIAGIGNLASGFVQGIYYHETNHHGVLHPKLAGFMIRDINIVAAFDIDERKVGKDISEAIFAAPNKTPKVIDIGTTGVIVQKGATLDGVTETTKDEIKLSNEKDVDVAKILRDAKTDVLVIATPSGSVKSCEHYVQAALDAEIAVINVTPTPIASNPEWSKKFRNAKIPLLGDDLQSQAGGTAFHKGVLQLLQSIGVNLDDTYQLDVSGGLEGLTTLDYDRRQYKRSVKENSISRSLDGEFNIASGTTDYLDFLGSNRIGYYWIKGDAFLGQPIKIDIRMSSVDGSNGAATLMDAVRIAKIALNQVIGGPLTAPSAYLFKKPPMYMNPLEAEAAFFDFVEGRM